MIWNYVMAGAVSNKKEKKDKDNLKNKDGVPLTEEEKVAQKIAEEEKREQEEIERDFSAYKNAYGVKLKHFALLELLPSNLIPTSIIDCWASILNYQESKRDDTSSPYRLFGNTSFFPENMLVGEKYKHLNVLKHFKEELENVVEKDVEKMTLKEYTVVLFPILEMDHFYLISFDLKNVEMTVIDNMLLKETAARISTQLKVREIFVKYLKEVKHPKAKNIENIQPQRLTISWATSGNYLDCGVFTMRHMEMWMGVTSEKWNIGFPQDKKKLKAKLNILRKKYAVVILLSDSNTKRDMVLKQAKKLEESKKK